MSYSKRNSTVEFCKYLIFKLGCHLGFASPSLAAISGCIVWTVAWVVLPGSEQALVEMPMLYDKLWDIGLNEVVLKRVVYGLIALGTYLGTACWCRLAVICYPNIFDRYKIKF